MRFPVIFGSKLYKRRDEHPVSEAVPSRMSQSWPWNSQIAVKKKKNFIKKETLAQVFSCELCKIFKNTFFTEHLRTTASVQ